MAIQDHDQRRIAMTMTTNFLRGLNKLLDFVGGEVLPRTDKSAQAIARPHFSVSGVAGWGSLLTLPKMMFGQFRWTWPERLQRRS
jgi:hypothetical protein